MESAGTYSEATSSNLCYFKHAKRHETAEHALSKAVRTARSRVVNSA